MVRFESDRRPQQAQRVASISSLTSQYSAMKFRQSWIYISGAKRGLSDVILLSAPRHETEQAKPAEQQCISVGLRNGSNGRAKVQEHHVVEPVVVISSGIAIRKLQHRRRGRCNERMSKLLPVLRGRADRRIGIAKRRNAGD